MTVIIFGAEKDSSRMMTAGGDWLFFTAILVAGEAGWWLKARHRKIQVEEKLGEVQEALDRLESLLTPARPRSSVVVPLPLRRRLEPVI